MIITFKTGDLVQLKRECWFHGYKNDGAKPGDIMLITEIFNDCLYVDNANRSKGVVRFLFNGKIVWRDYTNVTPKELQENMNAIFIIL